VSHTTDRDNPGDPMAAQELAVNREKALRAREQFEREYEERIQRERRAAGRCELCGEALTTLDRLRRATSHRRCTIFVE
jgi:hypothetical protein